MVVPVANYPVVNAGLLYVNGLTVSYVNTTSLSVAPGAARDANNIGDIVLNSPLTLNIKAVGPNGCDIPVATGYFYGVYVIGDSDGYNPAATMLSRNLSQPYMPFGYDMIRRVGWCAIDEVVEVGPAVEPWYEYGNGETRLWYYDVPKSISVGTPGTAFQTINVNMPPISTVAFLDVAFNTASGAATDQVVFRATGSPKMNGIIRFGYGAHGLQVGDVTVPVNANALDAQVDYSVTNAADTLVLNTIGFMDVL